MEYSFTPASLTSIIIFIAIVLLTTGMISYGAFRIDRVLGKKVLIFLILWIACLSLVVSSGLLKEHFIPGVPLFFAVINMGALVFALGPWGKKLAMLPLWMLVVFQGFRLPLEIVLHSWVEQNTIPATMTWSGQNFDVISGLLALVPLIKPLRARIFYWIFNTTGFLLLLNVLRVVVLSSPFPFSWHLDKPLLLALYLPYALIGIVCVWAAIVGHIILTRGLLKF